MIEMEINVTPTDIVGENESVFAPCKDTKAPIWPKKRRLMYEKLGAYENIVAYPPEGVVVVDVDSKEWAEKIDEFLDLALITPMCYETEKGKHYWFKEDKSLPFRVRNVARQSFIPELDHRTKQGCVVVKRYGKERTDLGKLNEALQDIEKLPTLPIIFSIQGHAFPNMVINDYLGDNAPRDEVMFKNYLPKLRSKKITKEQFVQFAVEVAIFNLDKEGVKKTKQWASQKWDSSEQMGKVEDITEKLTASPYPPYGWKGWIRTTA